MKNPITQIAFWTLVLFVTTPTMAQDFGDGTGAKNSKLFDATECIKVSEEDGQGRDFTALANSCDRQIAAIMALCRSGSNYPEMDGDHVCDDSAESKGWGAPHAVYNFVLAPAGTDPSRTPDQYRFDHESGHFALRWAACFVQTSKIEYFTGRGEEYPPGEDACIDHTLKVIKVIGDTGKSPRYLAKSGKFD